MPTVHKRLALMPQASDTKVCLTVAMLLTVLVCSLFLSACDQPKADSADETDYVKKIDIWHEKRVASLTAEDGWLSLAGLFWLNPGRNSFGSDKSNDLIFPAGKAPAHAGWFVLHDEVVSIEVRDGFTVLHKEQQITKMALQTDRDAERTVLSSGSLSWYVIKRGNDFAVRLKDRENPRIAEFSGIARYPVQSDWRIKARFLPYKPAKTLSVPTILGTLIEQQSPGALEFEVAGKTYRLDPIAEPQDDEFWILFGDETSGTETYGGGRFLYADLPTEAGITYLDFNKAYNPPCAFTEFATCPLPPAQNKLPVPIPAGEKNYHLATD